MSFCVKDDATDQLVRKVADLYGVGLTEAIRMMCLNELKQRTERMTLAQRIRPLRIQIGLLSENSPLPMGRGAPYERGLKPVYVTGSAIAEILAHTERCSDLIEKIETASTAFTSQTAIYDAARLLVDRAGVSPSLAGHGTDGLAKLAGMKILVPTDKVYNHALNIRKKHIDTMSNEMPDEKEIMDLAYCATFRTGIEVIKYEDGYWS